MKTSSFGKQIWIAMVLIAGVVLIIFVSWTAATSNKTQGSTAETLRQADIDSNWSKAILSVSNLSCGGCVDNITASLSPVPGIGKISVDISAGIADIYFNPDKLSNPEQIATAITTAGYPAKIKELVTANQVGAEEARLAQRAKTDIASVGVLDISRQDFTTELAHARTRYETIYGAEIFLEPRGAQLLKRIKAQIITRLISDGVKLQEVERARYQVPPQRVSTEMDAYLSDRKLSMDQLKANLLENGYDFDYFEKKFAQRVRVQSYLEQIVLKDSMDAQDRQQRYADWLSNARGLAKVVIFDKALNDLVRANSSSGCGGTSCSVAAKQTP